MTTIDFTDRVAIITGAGGGLGRAYALALAERGAKVVVNDLGGDVHGEGGTASAAQLVVDEITAAGGQAMVDGSDITDEAAVQKMVTGVIDTWGRIDILINNAGYTNPVPLQQVDMADFEKTINVNLYGPFTIVQTLLNLGNRFDLIVNIASTAGINGRSGWLTYSASKAAVINMSQVMREELAIYGTRVVCLSPGRTATALRRTLAPEEDPTTIMQPEHVARVIETLISPVVRFIDSENIVVRQ